MRKLLVFSCVYLALKSAYCQSDTLHYKEGGISYSVIASEKFGNQVFETRKGGLQDGLTVVLKENKVSSVINYKDGAVDGYRYSFYDTGKLEAIMFYVNGICHYHVEFHSNGNKKFEHVDNESECYTRFWDESGLLITEGKCVK